VKTRRVAWNRAGALSLLTVLWVQAAAWMAQAQSPPSDGFNPGANDIVSALAVQADGRIVLGGVFTYVFPDTVAQSRNRLARLNADGSLDTGFNPQANATVYSLAVQPDRKILVGGDLTTLGGSSRTYIGRLNTNGTLDTGFNTTFFTPPPFHTLTARVQAILVQPDGKIVIGGRFALEVGPTGGYVSRLNTNGTTDNAFNAFITSGAASGPVDSLALQPDGKILAGGLFLTLRGQTRNRIGRLNPDGTLDTDFNPGVDPGNSSAIVLALAVQPDGKILVGGTFNNVAGQPRTNLARLNPDGTPDTDFAPAVTGGTYPTVYSLALQTDGKILVGGYFSAVAGQPRANLARLMPDGSLDSGFNAGASSSVYGLAAQGDGKVLVGGQFSTLGGQARRCIGRLTATEPATQSLSDDGSTITWLRGGTSPEVWRTTFEVSTDLTNWTFLGAGTRIADGWELAGASPPPGGRIRTRGYTAGGGFNASSWFAETIGGPCYFISQPAGRTNSAGSAVEFLTSVGGSPPINYQWLRNGTPMQDGGQASGAQASALRLASVFGADAGGYTVIVSNVFGSLTSAVATLKVVDPFVTSSPFTNSASPGQTVTVTASAAGTTPLSYQWRKNGTPLPGATATSLVLTNIQGADIATYSIAVSNMFGVATSNRMVLEINLAAPEAFDPSLNGPIYGMLELADGKVMVGGDFTAVGGQTRPYLARLNKNGTLDSTFDPGTNITTRIYALSAQADGSTLVTGNFSLTQGDQTRYYLARVSPNGTLDTSFIPQPGGNVWALAEQADGKLLVGGLISSLKGQPRAYLGRLNVDGSLDTGFNPGASGTVRCLAIQADGKIMAGGGFTSLTGQPRNFLGRLNSNGTLDAGFNPGANKPVSCLAVQADGKILVGGEFTVLGCCARKYLGRLYPDGSLDSGFNPGISYYADGSVYSLAVQADGKILVGGEFDTAGGRPRYSLARLLPSGAVDPSFNAAVSHTSYIPIVSVGVLAEGKTLVAGSFTSLGGEPHTDIGRLSNTDPATQSLSFTGSTLTWLRGGTSPEVWRTSFDFSTNGLDWTSLGAGTRISGGWQLTVVAVPRNASFRARGVTTGGYYNGSSWFVESKSDTPPHILTDDGGFGFRSNQFGFNTRAQPGQAVVIEASTNFVSWLPLQTNLTTAIGQFLFADAESDRFTRRFYRARIHDGALPPPRILTGNGSADFRQGQFGFNLAGISGQTVVVETSTNLASWTTLATNTIVTNLFYFTDPGATNSPRRFYRARVQ
jgi:uncharacterized delta-60 repeat protein